MMIWFLALLVAAALGTGFGVRLRRRRHVRERRIEQPNSYYSAPGVRRLVDLERWGRIPLDQLHPLNRDEVRRLLRLARAAGSDSLAPKETRFLDNMARSAGGTTLDAGFGWLSAWSDPDPAEAWTQEGPPPLAGRGRAASTLE